MSTDKRITVLCDTREQRGWLPDLDAELFAARPATLATGDYTLLGLEDRFVIERKSLGDFVNTVIHDWLRFRKELIRLAAFDLALVVVEANLEDVFDKRYESDALPSAVLGRANGITLDHGVPVVWWGRRACAISMAERLFVQAHKKMGAH